MFFGDPTFILLIPVMILAFYAQYKVKSNYEKFSKIPNSKRITGAEVAKQILHNNGIFDVSVNPIEGNLTDHYHPNKKEVNLSEGIYYGTSIASLSIAAHEVGHAIQHAKGYYPVVLRGNLLPIANLGSTLAFPMFLVGLLIQFSGLMTLGIIFFSGALLFHLITLPVEFNASSRAIFQLTDANLVEDEQDIIGSKKMLRAAAMTYVASTLMALIQLVRMILIRNSRD